MWFCHQLSFYWVEKKEKHYKEDEELKRWFKGCVALALLPPEKVADVFVEIVMEEAPVEKYPEIVRFLDYMTMTWIDDDAKFPIKYWNHFHNENSRFKIFF